MKQEMQSTDASMLPKITLHQMLAKCTAQLRMSANCTDGKCHNRLDVKMTKHKPLGHTRDENPTELELEHAELEPFLASSQTELELSDFKNRTGPELSIKSFKINCIQYT